TFAISSEEDGERFIGEAIGVADQSGIFRMVSQTGLVCDGTYSMANPAKGTGVVECPDGRSGRFEISSTRLTAFARGRLGGKTFEGGAIDSRLAGAFLESAEP
ncbi:MAG: hypothetical protein AAGA47_13850, partial [Pseudomonadota bacterium]